MSTLKTNAIQSTTGKTLLDSSGGVIAVTSYRNGTRTVLSNTTDRVLWSVGTVNKKSSSSKLILVGNLPMRDGNSYFMSEWWRVGTSGKRYDGVTQMGYASDAGDASVQFGWTIFAEYNSSEVGNLQVDIGHTSRNGSSDTPCIQWNPNFNDDARSQQKESTLIIFEVVT